jgi:hypothetical protein
LINHDFLLWRDLLNYFLDNRLLRFFSRIRGKELCAFNSVKSGLVVVRHNFAQVITFVDSHGNSPLYVEMTAWDHFDVFRGHLKSLNRPCSLPNLALIFYHLLWYVGRKLVVHKGVTSYKIFPLARVAIDGIVTRINQIVTWSSIYLTFDFIVDDRLNMTIFLQLNGIDNSMFVENRSLSYFEAKSLIHSLLTEVLWFL